MSDLYMGIVIEESLEDNRLLNNLEIINVEITEEENPDKRLHVYTVEASMEEIDELSEGLKQGWYMHFWHNRKITAIFKEKRFEFDFDNKATWEKAINYGVSQGIPKEQLDFPIL
jgi:hypothetical protein